MKRYLIIIALLICQLSVFAQKEEDFATRFMDIHGKEYKELTCNTVSPFMMEQIMKLDTIGANRGLRKILSQLKSIQIVGAKGEAIGDSLFYKATDLAKRNKKRYKLYTNDKERQIYLRQRNQIIVEMVFITKQHDDFSIVNLTGNMNPSFLKELTNM